MDFTAIKRAGITQAQAGLILGVSRVTVNNWIKGRFVLSGKQHPRVVRLLAALHSAVEAGDLPAKHAGNFGEIKAAVIKHLPSKAPQA
jgi:DNA-binding transcriptional regulator YdaS (Cro superfamily)